MGSKLRRDFHAQVIPGGYVLRCRRCGTNEETGRDTLIHDMAAIHAQWFHQWGKPRVPPMGRIV